MDLEQARVEIDRIDNQILELIAQRAQIVAVIGRLKGRAENVRDPVRERAILNRVRSKACQNGLDPDMVEQVFQCLMDYFVEQQIRDLRSE